MERDSTAVAPPSAPRGALSALPSSRPPAPRGPGVPRAAVLVGSGSAVSLSRQVQGTGGSSAVSKCSAAARGYIQDRFLRLLAGRRRRRAPLIHRGYYIRARAVDHCVQDFLLKTQSLPRTQILSLGAGFDSLYFRLKDMGLLHHTVVYEVDFPNVACQKATLIKRMKELSALVGDTGGEGLGATVFSGENYKLLGVDLSELSELERALEEAGLDNEIPTLFIAEVVLTYMENTRSDALIQWAAEHFPQACFLVYEQVHPEDPFGRVMQQHFRQLNSALHSLAQYPDCEAQQKRFLGKGWTECNVMDMNEFFTCCIPKDEQQRVQTLEPFDEYEVTLLYSEDQGLGFVIISTDDVAPLNICGFFGITYIPRTSRNLNPSGMASEMFSLLCVGCLKGDGTFLDSIVTQCGRWEKSGTAGEKPRPNCFHDKKNLVAAPVQEIPPFDCLLPFSGWKAEVPRHADPDGMAGSVPAAVCGGLSGIPGLRRYGHHSVLIKPNVILTTGGFGEEDGQHCRMRNFHVLSKRAGYWKAVCVTPNIPDKRWGERLYHTVSCLSDTLALVVGGRTSPSSAGLGMLWLKFPKTCNASDPDHIAVEPVSLQPAAEAAASRWRHSVTETTFKGEQYLFVYGGRSALEPVLGDWYFLHIRELSYTMIAVEGPVPESRHSHSACSWEGGVLIAGGLGAAEQPLGSVFLLRELEHGFQWQTIETHPPLVPRYSHTAHVHGGKLLLVGGVWLHASSVPGITVIDLMTGLCLDYVINVEHLEWPLMLHNHSSVFLPNEKELLVIGGGGNCFSFGTHLNPQPVSLSLSSI